MWGGILGDDGIEHIEIGQTEVGLAFLRFQYALVELKERGVLLAVCSKNHQAAVLDVLDNHPDMLLRASDFVAVVANYEDKVSNLMTIRERLNLGFDSFVFLDDSPFERDIIRNALPDIQVPDLAEDPANVVKELARWNMFEGRAATAEDRARLGLYQADAGREALKARFTGLEDYLRELAMVADVLSFDSFTLPRVLQLIQRSNQFNLTTIRYSQAELVEITRDQKAEAFCVRLLDRLGDNGVIAVADSPSCRTGHGYRHLGYELPGTRPKRRGVHCPGSRATCARCGVHAGHRSICPDQEERPCGGPLSASGLFSVGADRHGSTFTS